MRTDADDLAGVFALEIVKGVESRDTGDAGDEQWQAIAQHPNMIRRRRQAANRSNWSTQRKQVIGCHLLALRASNGTNGCYFVVRLKSITFVPALTVARSSVVAVVA